MGHVIFKIEVSGVSETRSSVKEQIYEVLIKKSHQYLDSNIQYYSTYMALASPLQILHPELLYST